MKRIKIMKSDRQQRLCDAKELRGELCACMYCKHDRMKANQGIRDMYEVE